MAAPQLDVRDPLEPAPLIDGTYTDKTINDSLLAHVWRGAGKGWWACFGVALSLLGMLVISISWTVYKGIGVWGNNIPLGWALAIPKLRSCLPSGHWGG